MTLDERRPYRLVCRSNTPEWLAERQRYVTASEAAVAVGAKQPWSRPRPADRPGDRCWWGHFDEEHIVRAVAQLTGLRTRPVGWLLASKKHPGAGASLDAVARVPQIPDAWVRWVGEESGISDKAYKRFRRGVMQLLDGGDPRIALEIKLTSGDYDDWTDDEPPEGYWWQVQHQLLVTGWPAGLLAAREGAFVLHAHYLIFPDPAAQRDLKRAAAAFVARGLRAPWREPAKKKTKTKRRS